MVGRKGGAGGTISVEVHGGIKKRPITMNVKTTRIACRGSGCLQEYEVSACSPPLPHAANVPNMDVAG